MNKALLRFFRGTGKFSGLGVDTLGDRYDWNLGDGASRYIEVDRSASKFANTLKLKSALHRIWIEQPERRDEVARYFVRDWGGILANRDSTFRRHMTNAEAASPMTPFQGIASLSKILSIRDPENFAIYDSRVAVALTVVQVLEGDREGVYFYAPPGRNNVIGNYLTKRGFTQNPAYKRSALQRRFPRWQVPQRDDCYQRYIESLSEISQEIDIPMGQLEMSLFASAEELIHRLSEADAGYAVSDHW